jgi:two-component system, cell cycle response regulator DivK
MMSSTYLANGSTSAGAGDGPGGGGDGGRRQVVLVLEDSPHDWEIYGNVLLYNGFDVLYAADGETGLAMARERSPDLILIDLGLPKMDGLTVCRKLKRDPRTAAIPVVFLTARSRREFEGRAQEAGCVGFLEKPINPVAVLHEVERLIGRAPPPGIGRPPVAQTEP